MVEQTKQKTDKKEVKVEEKKTDLVKTEIKQETKSEEVKVENKTEQKKEVKPVITKKEEAVAKGVSVHMSKRQGMYISSFIKGKKIDDAINQLGEVIKLNRAIPFKGEIPHRKGMMSGRYPVNASKIFIQLLKALKGNSVVNGLDLDKTRIYFAHSTFASRPSRRNGKAKRAHITLKAKEFNGKEAKN
jgi:ribosomal protein L22